MLRLGERTLGWAVLALVFAALAGAARVERALVEVSPTRVVFVSWFWLPTQALAWAATLLVPVCAVGALAQAVRLPWLGLRPRTPVGGDVRRPWSRLSPPAPGGADAWRHLVWYRLGFERAEGRREALLADAKLLLWTLVAAALLAGTSWLCGGARRVEVDLDAWSYRRITEHLGLFTLRAEVRPLSDVVEASLERYRHEGSKEGKVRYTYAVALLLRDGRTDSIGGPKEECQRAVDALQRVLASRRGRGAGVEREAPPAPGGPR